MTAKPLASKLRHYRVERGLSARALSLAAGLGPAYIHNVELGRWIPRPDALMKIAAALGLDEWTRSHLRRLAGIDPDPGATREARAARREAWRPLLYLLVNHVMLPRLQLGDFLHGKPGLHDDGRELIALAAAARDIATFTDQTSSASPPGPALRRRIEETFNDALPDDIAHLQWVVSADLNERRSHGAGRDRGLTYRWNQRWAFARLLLAFNRPPQPEAKLYDYVHDYGFDYSFAVSFFPLVYWHSCRAWPFEKVLMPYARHGSDVQRQLYDAARSGLPLDDFDRVLIGVGELGAALARQPPARPSPEDLPEPEGRDWVRLVIRTPGRTHWPTSPRPIVDSVFDHLDRCEFLDRFPLLKVDRQHTADLARSTTLPSWTAWTDYVSHRKSFPPDQPPLSADRFPSVLWRFREREGTEDEPATLDSFIARRLTEEAADALARLLGRGRFAQALSGAQLLELHPAWLGVLRALAGDTPATPPDPPTADAVGLKTES